MSQRRWNEFSWATKSTESAKAMNEPAALQLADTIRQTAFEAHTFLRHGHNEKVCENSLRNRLRRKNLKVDQQLSLCVRDEDGSLLGDFAANLVVNDEFIVELKAVRTLADEHTAQVLGYLRAARLEHAMLINFGAQKIQFRKFIFRTDD
jgi:GxxExxY protein